MNNEKYNVRVRISDTLGDYKYFTDIEASNPKDAILKVKELESDGRVFKCEYMWLFENGEWGNMTRTA